MSMFPKVEAALYRARRSLAVPNPENAERSTQVSAAISEGLRATGQLDGTAVRRIIDATHAFLDGAQSQPLFVEKTVATAFEAIKKHADRKVQVPLDVTVPGKTQSLDEALQPLLTRTGEVLTNLSRAEQKPSAGWAAPPNSFEIDR